tara:strand:- start:1921 stop:2358 length:438 start_codon:yes stop_codon:yes gene_type:complete
MKKLTLIFLFISIASYSQYSKKELKKFNKMDLKIINRGLDLNATFVVYYKYTSQVDLVEDSWETAMFSKGLDVGDYSQQSNSLIFNGRYIFDTSTHGQIKIQDLQNNNKLVASITYKGNLGWGVGFDPLIRKKEYVIDKLIESNK